jgi:phytoene synthase
VSDLVPSAIAGDIESGRKASNLAFALRILPAPRRRDALVFYRFCRILDDIADSTQLTLAEKCHALDAWQRALSDPASLPADLAEIITRYKIDSFLLLEILAGMRADLTVHRYATFEEARQYCWRVASAVGLVSIRIFGCIHPQSEAYAESLGLALQWTNILRDIGEDAANGRIYLPAEDLHKFEVSEAELLNRKDSANFQRLMEFEANRARNFFAQARLSLPAGDRAALLPAEIMRETYERLLRRMTSDGFRVLSRRYSLSRIEKLWLASRVFLSHAKDGLVSSVRRR